MPKNYIGEVSEWSYLVPLEDLSGNPQTYDFTASDEERVDLARRMNLISVESATASVTVQMVGGVAHAIGSLKADVTQSCVVSLLPVPAHIEEEFEGWYGDKNKALSFAKARSDREAKKAQVDAEILEESVDPEPVVNGKIDLGELAAQYLSLALPPYPHADGVSYELNPGKGAKDEEGAALRKNPFEALKDWKEKR